MTEKTNPMRILDKAGVHYDTVYYECGDFVDSFEVSRSSGIPLDVMYKTLVSQGKSEKYCVMVVPAGKEADLKKAAKAFGEKSVELIPVKDINRITGYVRGGCSPLGIKRSCKIALDSSMCDHDRIYISGGHLGCSLGLSPKDLSKVSGGIFADISREMATSDKQQD